MPYALPADVKAFSDLASVQSKTDAELAKLITRAEAIVDSFCRQNFRQSAEKAIFVDGSGSLREPLTERLATLTQIRFMSNGSGTIISGVVNKGWYLLIKSGNESIRVRPDAFTVFPLGVANIEITGKFGYAAVPTEIRDAVSLIVERRVAVGSATASGGIFSSEKIGDYAYTIKPEVEEMTDIPDEAVRLLSLFKRPLVMERV